MGKRLTVRHHIQAVLAASGLMVLGLSGAIAPVWAQSAAPIDSLKDPKYWTNLCSLLATTKLQEALNACGRAVVLQPRNVELWSIYTDVQLALKQYPEALASATQALTLRRESSAALLQQCIAAAGMGQPQIGLEACDKAIKLNKNWGAYTPAVAWREQGRILAQVVKSEQPLQAFDESLKLDANSSLTQAYRCSALVTLGRGEPAIGACQAALKGDGRWGQESPTLAWYNLGLAYTLQGQLELAIAAYDQATALDPKYFPAWTQQGWTLDRLGRSTEALKSFGKAIELKPDHARALVGQCRILNQVRQFEPALAACQKALQGDNLWWDIGPAQAWSQQTHALVGLGRFEEAVAAANRAVSVRPDYPEAWNNRSVALFYLRKYPEAIDSTEEALRLDGNNIQAWSNRGKFLRVAGDYKAALLAYEQAVKVAPNNAELWADRSVVLWYMGQVEDSLASATKAVELDPKLVLGWQNQGVALAALKRYDEARASYETALKLTKDNADVWAGLGIVLIQLRQYSEAIPALQTALKLNPNQAIALRAATLLSEWQQRGGK